MRRPGSRINAARDAAQLAYRPVGAGGPLGPKHEHVGGAMHEIARCGNCRHRYLAELDRCPRCAEPSPDDYGVLMHRAKLQAASWALQHSRSHAQAADTLIGLLQELGLLPDPLCKWEPRTITDRWTGRRRGGGDAA